MISLPQGFKIGSPEAIDSRLALTFSEMVSMNDNVMPPVYFTICKDDSNIYVYNKENDMDEELGKFRLYSSGSDECSEPISNDLIHSLFE